MIEVCIVTYQRPYNIPRLLEQLKQQTIQDFKVNIWNNSGKKLDIDFPDNRIQIIESDKNIGSCARFKLVLKTKGTPIIFLDDDEIIRDNFIEYCYEHYKKFGSNCIIGWYAKVWLQESYKKDNHHLQYGEEADYIGTAGMVIDREIFDKELLLQNIPEPFKNVEDLYLCYLARMKHGMKMIKIDSPSRTIIDGKDQWRKIDKKELFKKLRGMGWLLLKDGLDRIQTFRNLIDFKKVMDKLEIPFILWEGVLLGAYRDNDFTKEDTRDIDFAIEESFVNRIPEIMEELKKEEFIIPRNYFKPLGKIESVHLKREGSVIDLDIIHKKNNDVYRLVINKAKDQTKDYTTFVFPRRCFEGTEKINFKGIELSIPKEPELYLESRYGKDWRIPLSKKEWIKRKWNPELNLSLKLNYQI